MSVRGQGFQLILGRALAYMFSMFLPIILVRVYSVEDYGYFQKINTILLSLITAVQFGFPVSLLVFYKQTKKKSLLICQSVLIVGVISLIFSLLFLLSDSFVNFIFSDEISLFIRALISLSFICGAIAYFIDNLLIVEGKKNFIIYYYIIDKSIKAILLISSAYVFKNILWLIIALSVYFLIRFLWSISYVIYNYPIKKISGDIKLFKEQIKFSLPMGLSKIVGIVGKKADHFILISTLSSASYAIYSTASFGIPFISLIYTSFGSVLLPKLSEEAKLNNIEMMKFYWHKLISLYAILTIPFILFFYAIADSFVRFLFTDTYAEAVLIYQIFLLIIFFQSLSYGTVLKAFKKTNIILFSNLISLVIALPLSYFSINNYGIIGGSLAAVTTYAINAIFQIIYTGKLLKMNWYNFLPFNFIFRIILLTLPSFVLSMLASMLDTSYFWLIVINGIIFFGSLYLVFTFGKVIKINFKNNKVHFPLLKM
jgi:O-antigen/teichoic acid export membrane protein